ncbi:TetR family transcriptional regulator [Meiothermus sp.]|uniref:TetR family transcriptional regulator n=1 Tax=Meiothermus sp. TaxID=1955249 RepID=UPI00307F2A57
MGRFLAILALALGMGGFGLTQGVRSMGMAGLVLPSPGAAYLNPAYAAFPAGLYGSDTGFQLPIGLLGLVLRPESNPLPALGGFSNLTNENSPFDLLTFYDQFNHPFQFLINPASSKAFINPDTGYPEIQIELEAGGVRITDYQGNPINLDLGLGTPTGVGSSKALTPSPIFRVPFSLGSNLYLDFGLFAGGFGLGLSPNPELRRALQQSSLEPNTEYALILNGSAQAGLSVGFGYATRLPDLPIPDFGTARLYVGTRGEAFYGLAYLEANGSVGVQTNAQGQFDPNQPPVYRGSVFYTLPGNGSGFGARADVGMVMESQGTTVGLGIRNALGFARWTGTELRWDGSSSNPISGQGERSSFGFVPAFFLNAATQLPLEVGTLIVGGDLGYETGLFGRIGGEYSLGPARIRAGLGFDNGFRFGLGAGFAGPGFTLDAALTTHRAPIVGNTVFGIALSLGLGF